MIRSIRLLLGSCVSATLLLACGGGGTGGTGAPPGGDDAESECIGVDAICAQTSLADCLNVAGCALKTTTPALGGYFWTLWQNPGSTAAWQFPPEATRVGALLVSPAESNAGTSLQLDAAALPVDLSGYAELSFTAEVATGVPFEVGLTGGAGTRGCTWDLEGVGGSNTYVVNLATPNSSWQDGDVAFDLTSVEVVSFACDWLTAASLDIVITSVTLR